MPTIKQGEKIPNLPLSGLELRTFAAKTLSDVLTDRAVISENQVNQVWSAFTLAMANDFHFAPMYTYPGVSFDVEFQSHIIAERFAFSVAPTFRFANNILDPKLDLFVRRPVGTSAPPLDEPGPDPMHVIDCFTLCVAVGNPNLIRVHCEMPFNRVKRSDPEFGEMFAKFETSELHYDPAGYPPLPAPKIIERSAQFAKQWGIDRSESNESREHSKALLKMVTDAPRASATIQIDQDVIRELMEPGVEHTPISEEITKAVEESGFRQELDAIDPPKDKRKDRRSKK